MEGFFIFDMSNVLIYKYSNEEMDKKLLQIAQKHELIPPEETSFDLLTSDIHMQIFNPLLANCRFMMIQFDNSFNYIKCKHGFNAVFDDGSAGFFLINISNTHSIEFMQRSQGMYKVTIFSLK